MNSFDRWRTKCLIGASSLVSLTRRDSPALFSPLKIKLWTNHSSLWSLQHGKFAVSNLQQRKYCFWEREREWEWAREKERERGQITSCKIVWIKVAGIIFTSFLNLITRSSHHFFFFLSLSLSFYSFPLCHTFMKSISSSGLLSPVKWHVSKSNRIRQIGTKEKWRRQGSWSWTKNEEGREEHENWVEWKEMGVDVNSDFVSFGLVFLPQKSLVHISSFYKFFPCPTSATSSSFFFLSFLSYFDVRQNVPFDSFSRSFYDLRLEEKKEGEERKKGKEEKEWSRTLWSRTTKEAKKQNWTGPRIFLFQCWKVLWKRERERKRKIREKK